MMNLITSSAATLCIMLAATSLQAQCSCTDCPVSFPSLQTTTSEFNVSGATNPTLGTNGQAIEAICINMVHDAIDEIDMTLIAPNGSSVLLIDNTGISVNDNITFEICFVACGLAAMPDPGFSAVFNSGEPWQPGGMYSGSYYPASGCLEDLTGPVDGTWTIEVTDFIGADDGILFDWCIQFADDDGLGCGTSCYEPSCGAEGGEIPDLSGTYCEGEPDLDFLLVVDFPSGMPDPAVFGYYFVVTDLNNGEILEFTDAADLTGYDPGSYQICGLSYLLADEPLLPIPPLGTPFSDLQDDIDNEIICAELSNCITIDIIQLPPVPEWGGDTIMCAGEQIGYFLQNYDPQYYYEFSWEQDGGGASGTVFDVDDQPILLTWPQAATGIICFSASNLCGTVDSCTSYTVLDPTDLEIDGDIQVCPSEIVEYEITPALLDGQSYDISVLNGVIDEQTDSTVTILWDDIIGTGEICIELLGTDCPSEPVCFEVEIGNPDPIPVIVADDPICVGSSGVAFVIDDPDYDGFIWTITGGVILSGQGTESIQFMADDLAGVEICVEVTTNCGPYPIVCEQVEVIPIPQPEIEGYSPDPICGGEFEITSSTTGGSSLLWTQIGGPDAQIEGGNTSSPEITVTEGGIYVFELAESNGFCTGTDTIEIEVIGNPAILNVEHVCDAMGQYTVSFTIAAGTPPYTVNGVPLAGDQFTSGLFTSGENYNFIVEDQNGCAAQISGDFTCACISDAGTMSPNVIEVCDADGEVAMAVHNSDQMPDGNDNTMYVLHDMAGNVLGNVILTNSTGIFSFQPGMAYGQTYYISLVVGNTLGAGVDLDDPCLAVAAGQPVVFYGAPSGSALPPFASCSASFNLNISVSPGVTTTIWSFLDGPGQANFTNLTAVSAEVNVTIPGVYTFEAEIFNAACSETIEIEFEVFNAPTILNVTDSCTSLDHYVLSFEVVSQFPPFSANIGGVFDGDTFTSDSLHTDSTYQVVVTDQQGCTSDLIVGPVQCDCISGAGEMGLDSIILCEGDSTVVIDFLGGEVLDVDDIERFVVHSGPGNFLVDPLFETSNTTFTLPAGIVAGQLYYISHVVGNSIGGNLDLTDPCLDVSQGQPLYIQPAPVFNLPDTLQGCPGILFTLFQPSGNGEITILSNSNNTNATANVSSDTLFISSDAATQLSIEYSEDASGCIYADTMLAIFYDNPAIANITDTCIGTDYILSFDISGGTGPYLVNGNPITGNTFTEDTVPSGTQLSYIITDANGCMSDELAIDVNCNCFTGAGSFTDTSLVFCDGDDIDLSILSHSGTQIEPDDTLIFVLHDGTATSLGTIIQTAENDRIAFDAAINLNTTYFISAVAGNTQGGSVDLNDPCLDISNGIPVVWEPLYSASISVQPEACVGSFVNILIESEGNFPFEITLESSGGRIIPVDLGNALDSVSIEVLPGIEEWFVAVIDANCTVLDSARIIIEGVPDTDPEFRDDVEVCNNIEFGSILDLESLVQNGVAGEWLSADFIIENDSINFDGADAGTYTLEFIEEDAVCPGDTFSVEIEVLECDCPIIAAPDSLAACSIYDVALDGLVSTMLSGIWSVSNPQGLPVPPWIDDDTVRIGDASAGRYELIYTITDSLPDNCDDRVVIPLTVDVQLMAGTQALFPEYCDGDEGFVDLFSLLEGADPGGQWLFEGSPVDPEIPISSIDTGMTIYTYIFDASQVCPGSEAEIILDVYPSPQFDVFIEPVSCFGESDGVISVEVVDDGSGPFEISINSIDSSHVSDLAPGTYPLQVVNASGCLTDSSVTLSAPADVVAEIGSFIEIDAEDPLTIEAIINIPIDSILNLSWADNSGVFDTTNLVVERVYDDSNQVVFMITSIAGCSASDTLQVIIRKESKDIFIPNVFNPESDNSANRQFGVRNIPGVERVGAFYVFDRWGGTAYSTEDQPPGSPLLEWDGRIEGKLVDPGVFVYYVELEMEDGRDIRQVGDVTVVR